MVEAKFFFKLLWRRIATRYDRCPTAFFSAIALAPIVIFWL
jgi:transposase